MTKKFNLIGFNFPDKRYKWQGDGWVMPEKIYKTCPYHHCILVPKLDDKDMLQCPECGTPFLFKDTTSEEQIISKFGPSSNKTKIVQRRKKKKYFSDDGEEVTDPVLLAEMQKGIHVLKYHEEKSGEEGIRHHVVRK
jgi:uncharacterized C2H2 Zn-finger protein